jgi:hypothetical protein
VQCRTRAAEFLALVAALLLLVGCASDVQREELPKEIDFSEGCDWTEDDDEHIFLGCEEGAYHARFKRTDERIHHIVPLRLETAADSMRFESDLTVAEYDGSSDDFELEAIGCVSSEFGEPLQGYLFGIAPEIHGIAIIKVDETDESVAEQFYFRALVDEESEAVGGIGETMRITGECRPVGNTVELTMSVDGEQVADTRDPDGFAPYDAAAFVVLSTKAGTEMVYDNVRIEAG